MIAGRPAPSLQLGVPSFFLLSLPFDISFILGLSAKIDAATTLSRLLTTLHAVTLTETSHNTAANHINVNMITRTNDAKEL